MNPTFQQLASEMPIAEFLKLQRQLMDPETKSYVRMVQGVSRRSQGNGQVAVIQYEPVEGGKFEDPGEIKTTWLTDGLAIRVGNIAKEATGRKCRLFQINKDKSADAPKGFRELVWIQVL